MKQRKFIPDDWHACTERDYRTCHDGVNCYSYALNKPDFYWAVPGFGFAHTQAQHFFDSFNACFEKYTLVQFYELMLQGAEKDGLIRVNAPENRMNYYNVALFFATGDHDFHWYRQDSNELWSHKNGWRFVTNKDDKGCIIHDPRSAVHEEYPLFGGFFLVPEQGIELQQTFPLL